MARLCDDCGTKDEKGEPCGMMFGKDAVEHCSVYTKDADTHKKLADRGKSKKTEEGEG